MDRTQNQWAAECRENENAIILDVRTPEEWEEGIIPGAKMLDFYSGAEFLAALQQLDKDRPYFVYCKSGGRSQQACAMMNMLGIPETYNLLGGFSTWQGERTMP